MLSNVLMPIKMVKGGHFTKKIGVDRLLYKKEFSSKHEAAKRERQIKGWTRKKKLALIKGDFSLLKKL
ncbi:GIY-YIG nuclease family protein [Candidatus Omnitrophota bacterium]